MSAISIFQPRMKRGSPAVCGPGKATFIAPNHPEFFTDWMIDKEISARVSPLAAAWATHVVVNGIGWLAQKFWLANNLIAQIPGNSAAGARALGRLGASRVTACCCIPKAASAGTTTMSRR